MVVHPMTFIGVESILAANAAACAADEGKFLDMNLALFQNQPATEGSGVWTGDFMKRLGNSIGIKSEKYEKCVTDGDYVNWTKNVAQASANTDVNGTPTVFINGKEIHRKVTNNDPKDEYMDPVQFKAALAAAGVK
jgi:protein-disulfide isomerase